MSDFTLDDLEVADKAVRIDDYTILSIHYETDIGGVTSVFNEDSLKRYKDRQEWIDILFSDEEEVYILSVRRNSDGLIFCIGDKSEINCRRADNSWIKRILSIAEFFQKEGELYVVYENDAVFLLSSVDNLIKKDEKLSTPFKIPPVLKGTRDSYLVVGGKIPSKIYDEVNFEWYSFLEDEQICFNTIENEKVDDLRHFEQSRFRCFYNDKQVHLWLGIK